MLKFGSHSDAAVTAKIDVQLRETAHENKLTYKLCTRFNPQTHITNLNSLPIASCQQSHLHQVACKHEAPQVSLIGINVTGSQRSQLILVKGIHRLADMLTQNLGIVPCLKCIDGYTKIIEITFVSFTGSSLGRLEFSYKRV